MMGEIVIVDIGTGEQIRRPMTDEEIRQAFPAPSPNLGRENVMAPRSVGRPVASLELADLAELVAVLAQALGYADADGIIQAGRSGRAAGPQADSLD
jgi:hypothetical protein